MTGLFFAIALIAQAGAISGVVRTEQGVPADGVRVSALSVVEEAPSAGPPKVSLAFIAATETDAMGRYRLASLPDGRYVIGAGLLFDPTYYPGTIALAEAKSVVVTNRAVEGVNFALAEWSACLLKLSREGRVDPAMNIGAPPTFTPPPNAVGRVIAAPERAAGGVVVRATRSADGSSQLAVVGADGKFGLNLPWGQYDFSLLLLPGGYSLKSIRSGENDLARLKYLVGPCAPGGGANAPLEIMLEPDEPRFSVAGRVTEAAGKALNNVLVQVDSTSGTEDRSFLKDGAFEFPGLAAGAYTIRVFAADLREILFQQIEVKDNDVTLALTVTMP